MYVQYPLDICTCYCWCPNTTINVAYGIPNWFENLFLDHVNYTVLDGNMTVIL
jgi:hypothetical protein